MPDESVIDAPAPAAAPTGGIDAMMAQLDAAAASGKTVATPAAEAPKADAGAAAKLPETAPVAKSAAPPPAAPAKPETKPDAKLEQQEPDWTKAPPKWHKIYEDHKSKTGETIKSLEAKIANLEKKPFEQPGDAKKLEAYEKQIQDIRDEANKYKRELTQADYTKSDDYKRQFVEPANRVYAEAVKFTQRLKVKDGEEIRQATQADFDYIRSLPADARRRAATEMFGDNAPDVIDFTRDIDRIKRDATAAVESHAAELEKTSLEREGMTKRQQQEYDNFYKSALTGIQENETWGKWFREDEADPEASKLLREGFEELEKVMAQVDKLPADQQAAYSAMYRARAAATPRLMLENNRLQSKLDAAMAELEKFRGTDPGAKGKTDTGAGGGDAPKPMGIDAAVAVFDKIPRN